MNITPSRTLLATALAISTLVAMNDSPVSAAEFNYDESNVPQYTLPDPLISEDGKPISSAEAWQRTRRNEILRLFQTHVYGRSAGKPSHLQFLVQNEDPAALDGKATRREVMVRFTNDPHGPSMIILIYLPNQATSPVPAFLGLNFYGNHTIHDDPGITLSDRWMRSSEDKGIVNHRATEASRGTSAGRWDLESILDAGFALATIYCGDLEPDHAQGWHDGVRAVFAPAEAGPAPGTATPRQSDPDQTAEASDVQGHPDNAPPDGWGAIGAWAWGLSRAMDYFETRAQDRIDPQRVVVMGHSRLGKTSLWAGAQDQRFAIVISNNSGCDGAALSRRRFGETVARINSSFPHWFCQNHRNYNGQEDNLPVDHHQLIALMAPRPVYIASAEEDRWADPRGEFLSGVHAGPVYALFDLTGLGTDSMPPVNQPVGQSVGYHIRSGKHDVTDYDWAQYIRFAKRHFKMQ